MICHRQGCNRESSAPFCPEHVVTLDRSSVFPTVGCFVPFTDAQLLDPVTLARKFAEENGLDATEGELESMRQDFATICERLKGMGEGGWKLMAKLEWML